MQIRRSHAMSSAKQTTQTCIRQLLRELSVSDKIPKKHGLLMPRYDCLAEDSVQHVHSANAEQLVRLGTALLTTSMPGQRF